MLRRRPLLSPALIALAIALAAVLLLGLSSQSARATHEAPTADGTCAVDVPDTSPACTVDFVAVDTDITGNSANTLGTREPCREVGNDEPFTIDIVIDAIPDVATSAPTPFFGVDPGAGDDGLGTYQFLLQYDSTLLTLNAVSRDFILGVDPDSQLFGATSPPTLLDAGPPTVVAFGVLDTGGGGAAEEAIMGVGARLNFTAAASGSGLAELTVLPSSDQNETKIVQVDNDRFTIGLIQSGSVAVGGATCLPDSDGDGVPDLEDACPDDPTETTDSDGDLICDNADPDDDNDGQSDADEIACGSDPLDAGSLSPDNESDGIPDCVDPDDDNDGQSDVDEIVCNSDPFDETSLAPDNDGDNSPDCVDPDDDNDGTPDVDDDLPFNPNEDTDSDGDGIGNNADTDDDNDGVPDGDDNCPIGPFDPSTGDADPEQADFDNDGLGNVCDPDDDNDGVEDDIDFFPFDPTEDADSDFDGVGDNADAFPFDPTETVDSDSDGVGDNADKCPDTPAGESVDAAGCSTAGPTPTPTPTAVAEVTQLPATGGQPTGSGVSLIVVLVAGAALLLSATGVLWAQRRRQPR